MTGAGGDTGRGVRAAARGLRTWRRLVGMVLIAALIGAASAAAWKASRTTTGHEWYAVGMFVLSETLIDAGLSPSRPKEIRHADGRTETVTLGAIAGHRPLLALRERILGDLLDAALLGLGIGAGIAAAALAALHYAAGRFKHGRRPRGGELLSARQLRRALRLPVLPAEIARLDSLAGYLKFPGAWPVAHIKLRYAKRPKVAGRADMREAEATRPEEAKEVIEQAREAEAAVDLWEPDPTAADWAERDLETGAMSRAAEGWPEEIVPLPAATDAGGENADAFRPNPGEERSTEGNGGNAGDGSPVANRPDARDGSASGDGKPASGLIRI